MNYFVSCHWQDVYGQTGYASLVVETRKRITSNADVKKVTDILKDEISRDFECEASELTVVVLGLNLLSEE